MLANLLSNIFDAMRPSTDHLIRQSVCPYIGSSVRYNSKKNICIDFYFLSNIMYISKSYFMDLSIYLSVIYLYCNIQNVNL